MAYQPKNITRDHVLAAIERIEQEQPRLKASTRYDILVNGKRYPPKEVMRYAHEQLGVKEPMKFYGGDATNKYFRELNFDIVRKQQLTPDSEIDYNEIEFFTKEDIDYYSDVISTNAKYRKENPADLEKSQRIKTGIFEKTNYWSSLVCNSLSDFDYEDDNAWNVSGNIKRYSWSRLFLKGQRSRKYFVTLGVSARNRCLVYKFDCQREGTAKLPDEDIRLFDSFSKTENRDWQEILSDDLHNYDWKSLATKTVEFINTHLEEFKRINGYIVTGTKMNISNYNAINLILYGPPGTGKTYNTINKAVELAEPNFTLDGKSREDIKSKYDELIKAGRITFVTFHQSLSYEDFIEGLKPQVPEKEGDNISYEVEDGIFKLLCNRARFTSGNFDQVIEKFKKDISASDGRPPKKIKAPATEFDITYRGTNVFYVQPTNTSKEDPWYPVNIENIRKAFESGSFEKIYNPTYVREVINVLKKDYGLVKGTSKTTERKENYVLIIDEINRGNVSQIFGELITLIEADKRENMPEALSIQLPYSKEMFSVPDNLFLIGTMNTADRSVEALDTALRRRFSFEFMPPDSSKIVKQQKEITVSGLSLKKLLDALNERIKYLLDEDHQIGHAYFCSVEPDNVEQLRQVFKNKIIPLLREYFYNDYAKIRMILGNHFVSSENSKPRFAENDDDETIVEKSSFRFSDVDKIDIVEALKATLNGKA